MQYLLIFAAAVAVFFMGLWTYRKGLQDGLAVNKGRDLLPIKGPIQAVMEAKQAADGQKRNAEIFKGLSDMINYTGDKAGDG